MADFAERYGGRDGIFQTDLDGKVVIIEGIGNIELRFLWTDTAEGSTGNRRVVMPKATALRLASWLVENASV